MPKISLFAKLGNLRRKRLISNDPGRAKGRSNGWFAKLAVFAVAGNLSKSAVTQFGD
jgi:hypothetical protein